MSYEKFIRTGRDKLYAKAINDSLVERLSPKYGHSDVVQATIMEAHVSLNSFRGETEPEFHAWLFGIYKHVKKMLVRGLSTQKRDYRRETDAHAEDGMAEIRSARRSPLSSIVHRENRDLIAEAFEKLTPDQAEVMRLRFVEGRTLQEIANLMGKSQKAVSGLIHRATKALCRELSK